MGRLRKRFVGDVLVNVCGPSVLFFFLVLMLFAATTVRADSTRAECGYSPAADTPPTETSACSFSQRQGYITINIDGGSEYDLSPTGEAPGNFLDADDRAVYRQSGLGDRGQLYRLPDQYLYVYWARDAWACSGEQLASPEGCELVYGALVFTVHSPAEGSLNELTVQIAGLSTADLMERQKIDGTAYRAEVADLDANGWPEIYIYISSAGSGSYGSLIAYGVNNGKSATPIYLPELAPGAAASEGYSGHDEFAVVENRLVRRYPLYKQGDVNAQPNGGTRQLQYRLVAGEAGWLLQVDKAVDY